MKKVLFLLLVLVIGLFLCGCGEYAEAFIVGYNSTAAEPISSVEEAYTALVVLALLGLIPAFIAKGKGRSFWLWWFYGCLLFWVAFIHALFIKNNNVREEMKVVVTTDPSNSAYSSADEIKKYKELLDEGIISEEEFNRKKQQILQ